MSSSVPLLATLLFVVSLTLGGVDYYFKEKQQEQETPSLPETASTSSSAASVAADPMKTGMSSSTRVVKKGVSTKKKTSVDVGALLASLQFMPTQTSEASLLQLITQVANAQTTVLLLNNDRAALFSWIESDNTKMIFQSVKQALQEQFSPKVTGLIDQTLTSESGPPVDMLAFFDPAISPEKVIFIRVRDRLYEFHVSEKGREAISVLIAELSK